MVPSNPISPSSDRFDFNNPRYLCCCRQIHVATFAKPIAILSLLMYFLVNIVVLDNYYYFALIPVLIGIFVYTTLLMGVWRRHRMLLLPYIIYQLFYLLSMIVLLVLCIAWLITPPKSDCGNGDVAPNGTPTTTAFTSLPPRSCTDNYDDDHRFIVFLLVVTISTMFLHIWYLLVIVRFYVFLTDYEIHRRRTVTGRRVHYMHGDVQVYPAMMIDVDGLRGSHLGPLPPYPADELPTVWMAPPAYDDGIKTATAAPLTSAVPLTPTIVAPTENALPPQP